MSPPTTGLTGLQKQNSSACKRSLLMLKLKASRGAVGGFGMKISIKMPNKQPLNEIWHCMCGTEAQFSCSSSDWKWDTRMVHV